MGTRQAYTKEEAAQLLLDAAALQDPQKIKEALQFDEKIIDAKNTEGYTALLLVAKRNIGLHSYDIIDTLLAAKANPNIPDTTCGQTPLMRAAAHNDRNVLEILISNQADTNVQDKKGNTSLILAASKGAYNSVAVLLAAGAKANSFNHKGETALDWALIRMKMTYRRDYSSFTASLEYDLSIISLLLAHETIAKEENLTDVFLRQEAVNHLKDIHQLKLLYSKKPGPIIYTVTQLPTVIIDIITTYDAPLQNRVSFFKEGVPKKMDELLERKEEPQEKKVRRQ